MNFENLDAKCRIEWCLKHFWVGGEFETSEFGDSNTASKKIELIS